MGRIDRGFDRDNGPERDLPAPAADVGDRTARDGGSRMAVETRTRAEARADLWQADVSGWDRHQRFEAPRGELAAFQARRAGLPGVTLEEAARYIERYRAGRPWLQAAERASPEALRVFAAADQGKRARAHPARRLGNRGGKHAARRLPGRPRSARPG